MANRGNLIKLRRMSRLVLFFVVLTSCVWTASTTHALDPTKAITQYTLTSWQVEEGLPQNTVRAIAQTPDGYLWIGTEAGLVRFDGVRFRVFDRKSHRQIFDNHHIYCLATDPQGTLWIGTNGGGLVRYRDGMFERGLPHRYGTPGGLPTGRVTALEPGADGDLWIGTYGHGVARLRGDRLEIFGPSEGLSHGVVFDLMFDDRGDLWIPTYGGGLNRLRPSTESEPFTAEPFTIETFTAADGLASDNVWEIVQASSGAYWVATNAGLNRLTLGVDGRPSAVETFTTANGLSHNRVISLLEDRGGNLWAGTYGGGIVRWRDGTVDVLDTTDGLPSDGVWTLFEDREGTLWTGNLGGGLNQVKDGPVTTFSVEEGLSSELPSSLYETDDGALWITTRNGGLNRLVDGTFEQLTTADGLSSDAAWTMLVGSTGDLWVGQSGTGLDRFHGGRWQNIDVDDGLSDNTVMSLLEDPQGGLWIATNNGLDHWSDGVFTHFTTADGLAGNQVRALSSDDDGSLWIGTTEGISHFDGESFTTYTTAEGLSSNYVWSLHVDGDGVLWVATAGGGLNRFEAGEIVAFNVQDGLHDDDLRSIVEDNDGFLWMSSSRGIFRVDKDNLMAVAMARDSGQDPVPTLETVVYGRRDGMKSSACYGGHPAGLRTSDGCLWFSTLDGVARIDPDNLGSLEAPPVILEELLADDEPLALDQPTVPHDAKTCTFRFAAVTLVAPHKVKLRYRLEGFEGRWHVADSTRQAQYNNLDPGEYTFTAMASDELGRWSGEPSSLTFRVEPAFHETVWFYGLCIALAVSLGFALHSFKVRNLRARERELEQRVEEALASLKLLRGLMPLCLSCKKVRDDNGYWEQLEVYITEHSEASVSHGLCPDCASEMYPDIVGDLDSP